MSKNVKSRNLGWFVRSLLVATDIWIDKFSLSSWCEIRPPSLEQFSEFTRRRESVTAIQPVLATFAFWLWSPARNGVIRAALTAYILWRVLDIAIVQLRQGIWGHVREAVPLNKLPRWRIQRALVLTIWCYIEVIIEFGFIYYWLGTLITPLSFKNQITLKSDAFLLSMSTLTTIGYSEHTPTQWATILVVTVQGVLGLFMVIVVIARIIALAENSVTNEDEPTYHDEKDLLQNEGKRWDRQFLFLTFPFIIFNVIYFLDF